MNKVILKGIIKDILKYEDHRGTSYHSNLVVNRPDGKEDIIDLRFKNVLNIPVENSVVELQGVLRTYSQKLENKNRVELYVDTKFESPEISVEEEFKNQVVIEGFICKKSQLRKTQTNKNIIDFVIANNLETKRGIINSYIPSITWDKNAVMIDNVQIGTKLLATGRYQSRTYKKYIAENDFEYRVAREFAISKIEILDDSKFNEFEELEWVTQYHIN